MGVAERQLLKHLMGGGKISNVQDEHHPLAILLRVPLIDLTIQIEVCSRTSAGRIAKTLSRSTPGLMVPIARIFVVGVDCMAVCPYPVVKPARPSITARPATRAYFIYLPLLTQIEVDLTVLAFAPNHLSRPLGQPGQHHGLEYLGIRDKLLIDLARLSAGDDFLVGVGRDRIEGVRDELLRRHAGLWHSSRSHSVSVCTARTPTTCRPASPVPQAQRECCE